MNIESRDTSELQTFNQQTNSMFSNITKHFFDINNTFGTSKEMKKEIEYGGEFYKDNSQEIYIPLDKDLSICKDYNGAFREDQSSYLCVLKNSKKTGKMEMKLYKKGLGTELNKKSLVVSSEVVIDPEYNQYKYVLNLHSNDIKSKDGLQILSGLTEYMKSYFELDEIERAAKKTAAIDEIRIQEIVSEETEATPDEILEKLWKEEGL